MRCVQQLSWSTLYFFRLQVGTTRAILCVGEWCKKGIIRDKDILAAIKGTSEDVDDAEEDLEDGWDSINF